MNNEEDFEEEFLDSEEESLIGRYEEMLAQGRTGYFDMSECEDIIDYYGSRFELGKAMQAIGMAERLHPLSPSIQLFKASILAFDNKPRKALNIILQLEQSEHNHDELDLFKLKIAKAYALISLGKTQEALQLQQEMLDKESEYNFDLEGVLVVITNALLMKEKYEEVVHNLQSFEDKIQLSSLLLGCMAAAYVELDNIDMAVAYYKKGIEQDPFDPALWCDLADVLEDVDEAMKAYDYALLLDEKIPQAYCGKAELLSEAGMTKEAEALLLKGVDLCPYDADLYDMLVEHYEATQDYDSAVRCCKKMVKKSPSNPHLWLSLARMCCHMELYEEALEACDTTALLYEDLNTDIYEVKASIYLAMGLPEKELEMYEEMLKCDEHNVAMVCDIGLMYESRDELDVAYRIYLAAIDNNPDHPQLYFRISMLFDTVGMVEEAYRCTIHALELDNQYSNAWCLLAMLQQKKGEQKEMFQSLKLSLKCKECSAGAIAMLYELIVEDNLPEAMSLLKYAEKGCSGLSIALPHCYMAALYFSLRSMKKCINSLKRALSIDADNCQEMFFEICPQAKKNSEVKRLFRLHEQEDSG